MADQLVTIGKKPCRSVFQRLQPQTGIKAVDDIIGRLEDEIARSQAAIVECLSRAQALTLPAGVGGGSTQLSAFTIPFVWRRPEDVPAFTSITPQLFWIQPGTLDATFTEEISRGLTEPGFVVPVPVANLTVTALVTDVAVGKTLHWDLFKNVDSGDDRATLVGDGLLVATGSFAPSTLLSRMVWGPVVPMVPVNAGDSLHLSISFDEGPGALQCDFLLACNALNGVSAVAGTPGAPGGPGPAGARGRRGFFGMPGDDGDDGLPGRDGQDGITPQTYFDLELSYGREDGVGTLAAFGTGSEGTPNFYLRPNTDLNVLTFGTGSPGEVWEYEVTRELQGTLVLDLCVYQCLITPQPATTATLTASVTKNATDILPSPNLDGITYSPSGTRVVVSLLGAHYLPGDRIGIHVNTTNFSSGVLMMTAHASCEEKIIAANSITGPTGPPGPEGKRALPLLAEDGDDGMVGMRGRRGKGGAAGKRGRRGLPWLAEDGDDGLAGFRGRRGKTGASGAGGITGGSGDATFSGTGVVPVTNVNAPDGFTLSGKVVITKIAAPASPASGKMVLYASATDSILAKDSAGISSVMPHPSAAPASQWFNSLSSSGNFGSAQPAFSDVSGTLAGGQFGPLTGDVTTAGYVAALQNIPANTPAAGALLATAIAAPATPAAGVGKVYVDSASKNLTVKDDAGVIKHGVQTKTSVASQFLTAIADNGAVSAAQPAFTDISGTATLSQLGNGSALSVLGQPANASGTRSDIAASASSDFPLREHSGSLGFGTLSTPAYGTGSVTYAKLQATTAGKVLLGRDVGAGAVQEVGIDATLQMTGGVLGEAQPYGWGLTFGGNENNSVGSTFPVFLGVGTQDWSTSSALGLRAPAASSHQDWCAHVVYNALIGGGVMELDVFVNGVNQGAIAFYNSGATGGYLTSGTTFTIASGDLISIRMTTFSGTINGGTIQVFVTGRFAR